MTTHHDALFSSPPYEADIALRGGHFRYRYGRFDDANRPADRGILCVHGIARNRHDFAYFADRCRPDWPAWTVDLIGHGDSDWLPADALYNRDVYLDQLQDLLRRSGWSHTAYIGTSYGGLLGIRLASMPDSPIRCLVLNDAGVGIRQAHYERIAKAASLIPKLRSLKSVEGWFKLVFRHGGELDPALLEALARHGVREKTDGTYALTYDPHITKVWLQPGWQPDPGDLLSAVRCPVLLVRGSRSEVIDEACLAHIQSLLPRIEVLEIDEAGHFPHLMSPGQVDPIKAWIQAHLS